MIGHILARSLYLASLHASFHDGLRGEISKPLVRTHHLADYLQLSFTNTVVQPHVQGQRLGSLVNGIAIGECAVRHHFNTVARTFKQTLAHLLLFVLGRSFFCCENVDLPCGVFSHEKTVSR